jgi:hypothetical protein
MLAVRKSGGPGKEVPPEESKNEPEKKERSARGGIAKKHWKRLGTVWKVSARRWLNTHASAAVFDARMKRRNCSLSRPIDRQKRADHESLVREVVTPKAKLFWTTSTYCGESKLGNGNNLASAVIG